MKKKRRDILKDKKAAKLVRYKRQGTSRYARKKDWRRTRLDGAPIPCVYQGSTWEDAQIRYGRGEGLEEVAA